MHTAHKQLKKLPAKDALHIVYTLLDYKKRRRGYIKWLDGRPGYRLKIGKYRAIFEFKDDKMMVLTILQGHDN